jgi:predicted dehydrogenase
MKRKLNVAMFGSGFMGKVHSHAWMTVSKIYDTKVEPVLKVAVGRSEKIKDFAAHWDYEEWCNDYNEVLNRPDIDIIDICTPTFTHKDLAIAAAKAGKHIFCEKPCALTYADCRAMADAANSAGVVHYLNHNYRRVPAVAYAKQLIESGALGTIYHWRGAYLQDWIMSPSFPLTWHLQQEKAGGGPLFDLNSHSIDLARYLIGEVDSVMAINKTFIKERPLPGEKSATFTAGNDNENSVMGKVTVDDASFMILNFENGTLGSQDASRFACGRKNYNDFEIYGSKGAVIFNFERMNELQFLDFTENSLNQGYRTIMVTEYGHPYAGAWWAPGHGIGYENTFVNVMADFLNAVAGGTVIHPNFDDGAATIRILEAAKLSSTAGRLVKVTDIH